MWQRAVTVGGGGGEVYEEFTLAQDLNPNSYVDFSVSKSTYKAIMWRGNNAAGTLRFSYANSSDFGLGVLGISDGTSQSKYDTDFFTFPNSNTLRFTNSLQYTIGAGAKIFIMF